MYQWIEKGDELPRVGHDVSVIHSESSETTSSASDPTVHAHTHTESSINRQSSDDIHGGDASMASGSTSSASYSESASITGSGLNGGRTDTSSQSGSSIDEHGYTSAAGTVIDSSGGITITSSFTESGSQNQAATGSVGGTTTGQTIINSTSISTGSTTSSDSFSSSFSTSFTDSRSFSTTLAGTDPGSWQTTILSTQVRSFTAFTSSAVGATVATTRTSLDSLGGTYTTTGLTSSTVSINVSTDSTAGQTVTVVKNVDPMELGFASNTLILASHCAHLYTSPGVGDGVSGFCEIFNSVGGVLTISQTYHTTQTTDTDDEGGSSTTYGYFLDEITSTNGPLPVVGSVTQLEPSLSAAYRPYSALDISDAIYESYTIHVASSVTDSSESTRRELGSTIQHGIGTQVLTLNSEDTLVMVGLITDSTFSGLAAGGGGNPDALGPISISLMPGVYLVTKHGTNGGSSTVRQSLALPITSTYLRGERWNVEVLPAYSAGAPPINSSIAGLMEISCDRTDG